MIDLKYVVVGTGRCGTVYMARLLTSLGINCSHEAIFNYRGIDFATRVLNGDEPLENSFCSTHDILKNEQKIDDWLFGDIVAESSYMAAPFLDYHLFNNVKIIHVVRSPMKVISSFVKDIGFFEKDCELYKEWRDFVWLHLPELNHINNAIERACYYYVQWNKMIQSKSVGREYIRYKVDGKSLNKLIQFVGSTNCENLFSDKNINSWKKRQDDITFDDIPEGSIKEQVRSISNEYYYDVKL